MLEVNTIKKRCFITSSFMKLDQFIAFKNKI
jgi:hypothetical protein